MNNVTCLLFGHIRSPSSMNQASAKGSNLTFAHQFSLIVRFIRYLNIFLLHYLAQKLCNTWKSVLQCFYIFKIFLSIFSIFDYLFLRLTIFHVAFCQ